MPRILLADDEKSFTDVYQELLQAEGFQVEVTNDGHAAYQALSQGGFDLVLLDIIMPGLDGITVLKKLLNHPPAIPNGPIYMLTVLEDPNFIKTCLTHGAAGYINKSTGTPEDLVQRVKDLTQNQPPTEPIAN